MSTHKPWKLHGVVAVVLAATVAQVLLITPVVHAADGGGLRRSAEERSTDGRIGPSHRDLGRAKRQNQRAQHEKSELLRARGVGKTKGNPGNNQKSASDSFIIKGDKIIVLIGDDGDEREPVGDKKPGKLRPNSGMKPNADNSHQSRDPEDWNDMGYQSGTQSMIPNSSTSGAYYINEKTDTIYVTKGSGGNGKMPGKKKPQKTQMKQNSGGGGGSKNEKPAKSGRLKPGKDKPSSSGGGLNEFGFVSGSQEKPKSDALNSKGDIVVKRGKGI